MSTVWSPKLTPKPPTMTGLAKRWSRNLYEAAGDSAQALANLDQMVLTDGFFDKADIEALKARLKTAQEAAVAP